MSYKEYLQFRRKLDRVKQAARAIGRVVTVAGLVVVLIAVGSADASPVLPVVSMLCAGLGLMIAGALPELVA